MFDEPKPVNHYTALAPSVRQAPVQVWTSVKQAVCAVQTRDLRAATLLVLCQLMDHVPEKSKRLICGIWKKKWTVTVNASTVNATRYSK